MTKMDNMISRHLEQMRLNKKRSSVMILMNGNKGKLQTNQVMKYKMRCARVFCQNNPLTGHSGEIHP